MEPLDDVVPVGIGHHHDDEDGLVPDDAAEELAEEDGLAPADVEQADHATDEDHQVGDTQIGAGSPHPLQEQRTGEDEHREQDGVGHVEAEDQEGPADRQRQALTAVGRHPYGHGHQDHDGPGPGQLHPAMPFIRP